MGVRIVDVTLTVHGADLDAIYEQVRQRAHLFFGDNRAWEIEYVSARPAVGMAQEGTTVLWEADVSIREAVAP